MTIEVIKIRKDSIQLIQINVDKMEQLNHLIKSKQFKKAEKALRKQLEKFPNDSRLLIQMANVLWCRFKEHEALTYADKATVISPGNMLAAFAKGRILWTLKEYKKSMDIWNLILNEFDRSSVYNKGNTTLPQSIVNDARFYKADCLFRFYRNYEALLLIKKHLQERKRGIKSDFTKKDALRLYKILLYCPSVEKVPSEIGLASEKQSCRIDKRLAQLKADGKVENIIKYLKIICKHYPNEYYYKTILSEYYKISKDKKKCLQYAEDAFKLEENDMLVVFNYAVALYINNFIEDAFRFFKLIKEKGVDYIAYSEHGEGLRWAKKLLKDTDEYIAAVLSRIR